MAAPIQLNQLLAKATQHLEARQWDKADRVLRKALKQSPNNPEILQRLGAVQRRLGHPRKAVELLSLALEHLDDDHLHSEYIGSLLDMDRTAEAMTHLDRSISGNPENVNLLLLRSQLFMKLGNLHNACLDSQRASELKPDNLELHARYVDALIGRAHLPIPQEPAEALVALQPFESRNHSRLATVHRLNGHLDQAMAAYEKALELDGTSQHAIAGMAEVLESQGDSDAAATLLAPHVHSANASFLMINAWMRIQHRRKDWEASIETASAWLASETRPNHQAANINHRLGHALEMAERYDEAFDAWTHGNAMYRNAWNVEAHARLGDDLVKMFSVESLNRLPRSTCMDSRPLFIMGMFRSGTTLIEQILSMHPAIHAAGEVSEMLSISGDLPNATGSSASYPLCIDSVTTDILDDMASRYMAAIEADAGDAAIITDKLPLNFLNLGLISLLLPGARIILCNRDPLDTCLSCFGNSFSSRVSFTADLEKLGHAYREYHRLMEHWRATCPLPMIELDYEDLVRDPEPQIRRLLEFMELEWDPACMEFHRSTRIAQTLSMDQVRQPMHTRSIHRSRMFWDQLAPLRTVLGDLAPDSPEQ
ncbi:MAG: sulfotransferase [Phycisphaerales bacterium]|nr:sulfotransferase [Phycisphaerales bacterium]